MEISFAAPDLPASGAIVLGVLEDRTLLGIGQQVDQALDGAVSRAMGVSRFRGKAGQALTLLSPGGDYSHITLVGLGKGADRDRIKVRDSGGYIVAALNAAGVKEATVICDPVDDAPVTGSAGAAEVAMGARLRAYRFDKYRTKEKEEQKPTLTALTFQVPGHAEAEQAFATLERVAEGVIMTRNLVSEPANIIYPETLAEAGKTLSDLGIDVTVLGEDEMKQLGMGALLGVGQGSARESKLLVMEWKGGAQGDAPVAFIGKGVTFDTGGISIKPAAGMEDMKWDMGGAGVVIGLMKALAGRKAKVNVVGVAGLVENMPSSTAQRPGDIVTSMSGQTIEVINTDAEGRLVLADALWYTQDKYKPKFMVNLATLTGAIIIALGHHNAGLFSNNDELAERITAAGKLTGENVWRLPISDDYNKQINTDSADMKNVGGRDAGSITAAQFLQRFVNDTPWAHIDIAGTTWSKKDAPTVPKGGTGFGVQLLNELVAQHYEAAGS